MNASVGPPTSDLGHPRGPLTPPAACDARSMPMPDVDRQVLALRYRPHPGQVVVHACAARFRFVCWAALRVATVAHSATSIRELDGP